MSTYIARFDLENYVIGTQRTPEDLSVLPPQFDPDRYRIIAEVLYTQLNSFGLRFQPSPGGFRWQWDGVQIVELTDTRKVLDVTFSKLTVGIAQDSVQIDLDLLNPDLSPTNFNGAGRMLVTKGDGRPNLYRVQFTGGSKSVAQFKPTKPGIWTIEATEQYYPIGDTVLEVVEDL